MVGSLIVRTGKVKLTLNNCDLTGGNHTHELNIKTNTTPSVVKEGYINWRHRWDF